MKTREVKLSSNWQ